MKAVFVHDHKFRKINGKIYSPGSFTDDLLSRYVDWFGTLTVIGRIIEEGQAKANYSQIINPNVTVAAGENLKEIIKNADCVVARVPSINGYKAIRYAKRYKKPYLVEVVGCTFDAYWNYGFKGKIFAVPAYLIMRHCVKNAPYAVYVTSEFLQRRYPCKGKTIGVSDVAIESISSDVIANRIKKIQEGGNRLVLGTAGAIDVEYKGQEYVIRAIPELKKRTGMDIIYELAGTGDSGRLRKIAESLDVTSNVVFKGAIKHDEIFAWLDNIDIYVQPSIAEGLSRAVIEAMSRGLPCIVAEKGGNPELIEKKYLFTTRAKRKIPEKINECTVKLLNDMDRTACRNYEYANNRFDRRKLDNMRSQFYEEFAHS